MSKFRDATIPGIDPVPLHKLNTKPLIRLKPLSIMVYAGRTPLFGASADDSLNSFLCLVVFLFFLASSLVQGGVIYFAHHRPHWRVCSQSRDYDRLESRSSADYRRHFSFLGSICNDASWYEVSPCARGHYMPIPYQVSISVPRHTSARKQIEV